MQIDCLLWWFFDKATLNDEELTALTEIKWNKDIDNYFLCGNHESSVADLRFSSLTCLAAKNRFIISDATKITVDNINMYFIPYVVDSDRKPLAEYLPDYDETQYNVIFSHNDIAGINYGMYESKNGFSIDEISNYKCYYLNGHLHNSEWITNTILNLGSFSGHNFTNDSERYKYGAWILDTDTNKLEFFENPYSFNFYKIDITSSTDLARLDKISDNSLVSIKCPEALAEAVNNKLSTINTLYTKVSVVKDTTTTSTETGPVPEFTTDYIGKFCTAVQDLLGNTPQVRAELAEICK